MKHIKGKSIITIVCSIGCLSIISMVGVNGSNINMDTNQDITTTRNESFKSSQDIRDENSQVVSKRSSSNRGGRMLDLDVLSGDINKAEKLAKDKDLSGHRQSRNLGDDISIVNEGRNNNRKSSGKKLEIKGFIPIMSITGASGKDGKQFDSIEDATDATDDSETPQIDGQQQQQQQQLKSQLLSNFGGQTSIGHASFALPSESQASVSTNMNQPQQQNQLWAQQGNQDDQLERERGRKLSLGSSSLLSGPKRLVSSLVSQVPQPLGFGHQQQALNPYLTHPNSQMTMMNIGHHHHQQQQQTDCICVPFYQCKNGQLNEWQLSKSQMLQLQSVNPINSANLYQTPRALNHLNGAQANDIFEQQLRDQQQQQQQQEQTAQLQAATQQSINHVSPHQEETSSSNLQLGPQEQQIVMNQIYEQLRKNFESGQLNGVDLQQQQQQNIKQEDQISSSGYGQLDERNANSSSSSSLNGVDESIEERGIFGNLHKTSRMGQSGQFGQANQRSCGIMRTCCRLPQSMIQTIARPQVPQRGPHNGRLTNSINQFPLGSSAAGMRPQFEQQLQQQQQQHLSQHLIANHGNQNSNNYHNQQMGLQQPATYPQQNSLMQTGIVGNNFLHHQQQQQQQQSLSNQATSALMDIAGPTRLQPSDTNSIISSQQFPVRQSSNGLIQQQNSANFMSGRCGVRETLGIAGRVQNTNPMPGSESLADFGEFPAHAAILKRISPGDSLFVCSAVLISNQWLVTAAHCVRRIRAEDIKVRLGEWDVSKDDEFYPFVESNIRELIIHPEFQASSLANDIALLRMEQTIDVQTAPHIAPACLAYQNVDSFNSQRCWIAGWGKDAFGTNGQYQSQLKKVDLPIVGRGECENALRHQTKLGRLFRLHQSNLCAGGERGKDACEGDGGAGLYCIDGESGITRVLGLVSWGVGCGQRGVPGIYTSIPALHSWIENQVAQSGEENVYIDRSLISERSNEQLNLATVINNNSTTTIRPEYNLIGKSLLKSVQSSNNNTTISST